METLNKITLEQIINLLPKQVELIYIDYRDNLDEHLLILQECLDAGSFDKLYESIDEWFYDAQFDGLSYVIEELKSDIENEFDIEDASHIIEDYEDEITDVIYERDISNPLKDLFRNTSDIPVRVSMYSNYDCINSHHFEGGYSYKDSYFGAMVDTLKLNPAKVKKMLVSYGVEVYGAFPNLKYRDGKELVSYKDFWQEIGNSICGANLLVFVGTIEASNILDLEKLNKIKIPKGNNCGLFSSFQGGGSLIEMELKQDFVIDLNKQGKTKYDTFGITIDCKGSGGYSVDEVYGVTRHFWGNKIEIL